MLDYQIAKNLCAEIKAKIAEDPKFKEDTIWEEFVVSSIRYVGCVAEEHLRNKAEFDKYTEVGEDGLTVQEFMDKTAESALSAVKNVVCSQLGLMGRLLNMESIKELLANEEEKLQFAWYVAMFELLK